MALRGLARVYRALYTALDGINGTTGGYYHALTGRVLRRLVTPDERAASLPYLCLPVDDAGPFVQDAGSAVLVGTLQQAVIGFVAETTGVAIADSGAVDAFELVDDICRAVMPATSARWNLGDAAVRDVRPVAKQVIGVDVAGIPYLWVEVDLEIDYLFARHDLGPGAVA